MRVLTQPPVEPNFPSTETRDLIQGLGEAKQGEREAMDLNPSQPSPSSSKCSMEPSLEQQSHTHTLPINDQGVGLESHAQSMTTVFCEEVLVQHMMEILHARRGFTVQSWNQVQVHPGHVNFFEALREKMKNLYMVQVGSVLSELPKEYLGIYELLQHLRQQRDIRGSESKVELLSKVTEVGRRMTEFEEHTPNLHADLDPELTKVSRDIPNVVINPISSALQLHNEISIRWHKNLITLNQLFKESSQKGWRSIKG